MQKILFLGLMSLFLQEEFLLAIDKILPMYNSITSVAGSTLDVNTFKSTNWMKYSGSRLGEFQNLSQIPSC